VPELVGSLREDEFAYGLMRLGFGSGRFRRVKWVSSAATRGAAVVVLLRR
jgi:hypothetical protein